MHPKQEPVSITSAAESLTADQGRRTRIYLIQMGIRVTCIIAAVLVPGPARWILVGAAVVLPYIAVVNVNMGRSNNANMDSPMEYLALEAEHRAAAPNSDTATNTEPNVDGPETPGHTPEEPLHG